MMSNTEVSIGECLDEVLESDFDSGDNSDDFGHLDSESKEEEDEGVSAYTYQQCLMLHPYITASKRSS